MWSFHFVFFFLYVHGLNGVHWIFSMLLCAVWCCNFDPDFAAIPSSRFQSIDLWFSIAKMTIYMTDTPQIHLTSFWHIENSMGKRRDCYVDLNTMLAEIRQFSQTEFAESLNHFPCQLIRFSKSCKSMLSPLSTIF